MFEQQNKQNWLASDVNQPQHQAESSSNNQDEASTQSTKPTDITSKTNLSVEDQMKQSFERCGKSVCQITTPFLTALSRSVLVSCHAVTFAATLIWSFFSPLITSGLSYLMVLILGIVMMKSLVPNAGGMALQVGCSCGLQYMTWLGSFVGIANICTSDLTSGALGSPRRGSPVDTVSGFNWTQVNKDLTRARNIFANVTDDIQKLADSTDRLQKSMTNGVEIHELTCSLSSIWTEADSELEELLKDHGTLMDKLHRQIKSFTGNVAKNFEKYQEGGPAGFRSWWTWIPGFPTPMSIMRADIANFASENRVADLNCLIQQTQKFARTVRETEKARTDIAYRFKREWVSWVALCFNEETHGIWGFQGKRLVKKKNSADTISTEGGTNPACELDLEDIRHVLQQDLTSSFDALKTFADASLLSYRQLIREYSSIVGAVEDAKFAAETYRSWDYETFMILFADIHEQVVDASKVLIDLMSAGKMSE